MKKLISYSIFNAGYREQFEFNAYLRGLYLNARMNRLIYPEWITHVEATPIVFSCYYSYLIALQKHFNISVGEFIPTSIGQGMLRRMNPLWADGVSHVLCRDADAITTYREAQAVQEWLNSGLGAHMITDNPAHGTGMMGGMIGFKTDYFRGKFPQWTTFDSMLDGNIDAHGKDQNLLNTKIYPTTSADTFYHCLQGGNRTNSRTARFETSIMNSDIPNVNPKLWESNLTARHIGSAGVVELELLRFFKRFDQNDIYSEFEKEMAQLYPKLFYWV